MYDFKLQFRPLNAPPNPNSSDPDLPTALRDIRGRRLEASKEPELVLVINKGHLLTPN